MGVYAYRRKHLEIADGRIQSELIKDLNFRITTAYQRMATRFPKHDFVLTISDVEKDDPLAPTPFGMHR